MSNQSYTKGCRDCGQQIRMAEVNGKWAAYELNGNAFHTCLQKQQKPAAVEVKPLTLGELDARLKRVEKMLFNGGA